MTDERQVQNLQQAKQIPFDKEKALAGQECFVLTINLFVYPVKIVFDDKKGERLLGVITNGPMDLKTDWFSYHGINEHGYQIYMKPKVQTMWVNVYRTKTGDPYLGVDLHQSEEDARLHRNKILKFIKTISFDVEV